MDERNYLLRAIRQGRRKLNIAKTLDTCTCLLACAGVAAIILEAVSIWIPFYYVHVCAGIALLVALLAGLVYAFVKRVSMKEAAQRLDTFGLKERTQTAYEQLEDESAFAAMQRHDAVEVLKRGIVDKQIKIRMVPDKRRLIAMVLSLAVACGLAFLPSQARNIASQRHAIRQEAKEKQEELEELADALEQMDTSSLTDEQKAKLAELSDALSRSMQELSRADSREALDAAESKLGFKYDQANQSLMNMASELSKEQQSALAEAAAMAKAAAEANGQQSGSGNGTQSASNGSNGTPSANSGNSGDGNNGSNGNGANGNGANGNGTSGDGNGSDGNGNGDGQGSGNGTGNGNGTGSGSGNGGSGNGNGTGRGTGQGGGTHDYVSVPNATGDDDNLTGNKTGDNSGDSYRAQNGLVWEGDHVSLDSVIGDYTKNTYEGISSGRYPSGMENVIKDYFKNLSE